MELDLAWKNPKIPSFTEETGSELSEVLTARKGQKG
jgi:hypothetical protein